MRGFHRVARSLERGEERSGSLCDSDVRLPEVGRHTSLWSGPETAAGERSRCVPLAQRTHVPGAKSGLIIPEAHDGNGRRI